MSWIVLFIVPNERENHTVDTAQQKMIAKVQEAHLLGGTKQNVLTFFREQKIPCQEYYGELEGDGGEIFLSNKTTPSTFGMIIGGSSGCIAHTTGYLGCTKSWSLETHVLFDGKGKVVGVEVIPTYFGCDI